VIITVRYIVYSVCTNVFKMWTKCVCNSWIKCIYAVAENITVTIRGNAESSRHSTKTSNNSCFPFSLKWNWV